jgi:hypothetical protein
MSAGYLSATCLAPINSDGKLAEAAEAKTVLFERIDGLASEQLEALIDWMPGGDEGDDELRAVLRSDVEELVDGWDASDRYLVCAEHSRPHYETGGVSWGDSPTDCFDAFIRLGESGILEQPIDGGFWFPAPLRKALDAFADELGLQADAAKLDRASSVALNAYLEAAA